LCLLEWSSIDRSVFHFVSHYLSRSGHSATETSNFMPLVEAQIGVKLEPSLFNTKSASPVVKTQEESLSNTGPTHFVSALEKFNEVIPGCDAIRRFQDKPNWCLANKTDGSRCRRGLPLVTQNKITHLLTELAGLNIYGDMQKCLDKLIAFTSIAVCCHQQDFVIWKLQSLLRAYRSRSSTPINSITSDLQTERSRVLDRSRSVLMKQESGLNLARKEEREIETPITTSAIKITYWLRESPVQALVLGSGS